MEAEAAHFSKTNTASDKPAANAEPTTSSKRQLEAGPAQDDTGEEDIEAKRRRVLEESRDVDADSVHSSSSSSEEDRYCHQLLCTGDMLRAHQRRRGRRDRRTVERIGEDQKREGREAGARGILVEPCFGMKSV